MIHPRSLAAVALLVTAAPLSAQSSLRGLTPEQVVLDMRSVAYAELGDGFLIYTVSVPRPLGDGPGSSYLHLYAITDFDAALAGRSEPRVLVGGKERVRAAAVRPGTSQVSLLKEVEDAGMQMHAMSLEGGEAVRIAETPNSVGDYRWRPDGKAFAYTSTDPMPASREAARKAGFRQTVADEDFRHRSLWLWEADEDGGTVRKLTEGRTVFDFAWSADGSKLAVALAPRNLVDDSYMFKRLYVLEPVDGVLEPLVDNPGKLGDFTWSPDGSRLAYVSAVDRNDPHAGSLFVLDTESDEVAHLTPGFRGMVHHVSWQKPDELLCLTSRGVHSQLVRVDPDTGDMSDDMLSTPLAVDTIDAGADGRLLLTASAVDHPDELFLMVDTGGQIQPRRVLDSNPWLRESALGRQEVVRFPARDGQIIEGLLIYPLGYREEQRYPMVIVAHGGPESHYLNGWLTSYSSWGQMLAARGYFAWYPNYRASTGYGVEFAKADHGDPMGGQFRDHLDAIDWFDEQGLIDSDRVGIGGGSYGGYTAAWAATRHTEHFAAAVSFVPFVDIRTKWMTSDIPWEFYYVHYQETWPWEQPGLLADRSPLTWAQHCDTPLLLVGGTADTRVHPSQPFMLYRAVKFGTDTPVRYVQYPGEGHGNRTNVYRYDYALRSLRWFDHYLQGEGDLRDREPPNLDVPYPALPGGNSR